MMAGLLLAAGVLYPCTMFKINKNGKVLVGNNEDYIDPITKAWFTPAEKGKYGTVYFGYSDMFPQGGINDQGLIFDGFSAAKMKVENTTGKEEFKGNLIEKVMSECASVEEAVKLFNRYSLHRLESAQLMLVDKTGDSVIIEGDVFHRDKGEIQVVTNFYLSQLPKGAPIPCERYKRAAAVLEKGSASLATCRAALSAAHNEGEKVNTLYSNIYDPVKKLIYLYYFHNFEEVVVIDLEKELKKGKHIIDIPPLFTGSFAADRFMRRFKHKQLKPIKLDPAILDAYTGTYKLDEKSVAITKENGRLFGQVTGQSKLELFPLSETRFFVEKNDIQVSFVKDKSGQVTELIVHEGGQDIHVAKIKENKTNGKMNQP